jgi:thioredoxin 1
MKNGIAITAAVCMSVLFLTRCVNTPTAVGDGGDHAPDSAVVVTIDNLDSLLDSRQFAIVEFYSSGCPVCASLVWVIDSLAETFGESALVGANKTDDDTLWERFSITSVPTYVLFNGGEEVTRRSFTENKPEVFDTLKTLLSSLMSGTLTPDTVDTGSLADTTTPPNYLTLDTLTFDTTVLRDGRVAMVFFLYAGGAPCIYMDSVVKKIAPSFENEAVIAKVHAWEQKPLSERYDIYSVPQFLFFKDSALVEQRSGIVPGDTLTAILGRLLEPAAAPATLDAGNFDSLVTISGQIAMVDFYSPLCPACRIMDDTVAVVARQYNNRALVGKVNVDENDSLRRAHNVNSWPTFVFYDGGTEYERMVGIVSPDSLGAALERGLGL